MITIRLKTAIAVIVPGFCLSIGIAGVLQGILVDRLTHCRTRCLCLCCCCCIRCLSLCGGSRILCLYLCGGCFAGCLCCFHPTLGSGSYWVLLYSLPSLRFGWF